MGLRIGNGLATGLDTESLVQQLMALEARPLNALLTRKSNLGREQTAFQNINAKLSALKEVAKKFTDGSELAAFSVSSSSTTLLTGSASGGAVRGTYSVEVRRLATVEREQSQGFADKDATSVGTGTFKITVGAGTAEEELVEIAVASGDDTLAGLAAAINDQTDKVVATVIDTGDGSGTPFRLLISSAESGKTQTLTFDTSALSGGTVPTFTETQAADDAHLVLGGVGGLDVYSSSNSVTGVIQGVTLDLKKAEIGTIVEVAVAADTEKVKERIKEFVDAYNGAMTELNSLTRYDAATKTAGLLQGDATAVSLKRSLAAVVASRIEDAGLPYESLSQIGITSTSVGTLQIKDADLDKALAANFSGVVNLFKEGDGYDGLAKLFYDKTKALTEPSETGEPSPIEARLDGFSAVTRSLDQRIDEQSRRLDRTEASLRARFVALELLVSGLQGQQAALQQLSTVRF